MDAILAIVSVISLIIVICVLVRFKELCDDVRRIADEIDPETKARRDAMRAEVERQQSEAFMRKEE